MRRRRWAVLALVPLLSGCGALGLAGAGPPGAGATATPQPTGPGWIVVAGGSATPSPMPSYGAARPSPVGGFLPLGATPETPFGTPTVVCSPNTFNFSQIAAADVTPSTTSAVVSWYNIGGYNLVQFRLTAISQNLVVGAQRDVGWVTVAPKTPCGPMSARVTGLDRKTDYVFSVDAVVLRRSGDGTRAATVARSHVARTR
jgi:hypothetical protein